MLYSPICRILGKYFIYFSAILIIPLGVSVFYENQDSTLFLSTSATFSFAKTILVSVLLGFILSAVGRRNKKSALYRRESIFLVVLIWLFTAAIAALPFLFTQALSNPMDACFESMSGLTTTGATIIHPKAYDPLSGKEIPITMQNPLEPAISYTFYGNIAPIKDPKTGMIIREGLEALGKPLLFWRCFLQWLGGIGVVVLFIAILPALSISGKFLYETEITGPSKEGLTPRIKDTALFLLKIYLALTAALILSLFASDPGMPFFDLITLSLSTISTGGFVTHNSCLTSYLNAKSLSVICIFMILGGLNFSLYFYCIKRRLSSLLQPELFYYLIILLAGGLLVAFGLWNNPPPFPNPTAEIYSAERSLANGLFQAVSAQTSTGFSIANYDAWPYVSQFILVILMYVGGMSGSSAGGMKVIRFVIVWRFISYKIETFFHRDVFRILKVGDKEIPDKSAGTVLSFFCIVIFLVALGTFFLTLDNNDPLTSLAIVSSMVNNAGLFFGGIGCTASLAYLSDFSKFIAILWMILGRLEFLSILALLLPAFWKNK